jgi:hypothetical protein
MDSGATLGGPSTVPGSGTSPSNIPPPTPRPHLVYVTGSHRSGGTILGLLLAAHPQVFLTGALYKLPVPAWTPGRTCSCGVAISECPFWTAVVAKYRQTATLEELRKGQVRYESWGSVPRSLLAQAFRTKGVRRHVPRMAALVAAIAAESGRPFVVDASRAAIRGKLYSLVRRSDLDVSYIHLVRDGRAFIQSELKLPSLKKRGLQRTWIHAPAAIAVRWVVQNVLSIALCSGSGRHYLRIRYEDLILRPDEVLGQIGAFLGLDLGDVVKIVKSGQGVPIHHVLPGNRFVKQGATTALWSQPVAGDNLGAGTRVMFWTVAGWLAGFLGYRPKQPTPSS